MKNFKFYMQLNAILITKIIFYKRFIIHAAVGNVSTNTLVPIQRHEYFTDPVLK